MTRSRPSPGAPSVAIAPSLLRTMNQRFLMDWLYRNGPATRPQLARDSGLSQPTVFATLANLVEAGLVRPRGQNCDLAGRPALVYEADPTAGGVLAIELGSNSIRVVTADLMGTRLSRVERHNRARNAKPLGDAVRNLVAEAAEKAGRDLTSFSSAVVAIPGVYRSEEDRVTYAPHVAGLPTRLVDALRDAVQPPILVENRVNLAALAEYTEGAGRGVSPLVYLHIGTGIGMGLIVDGELYRGASGAAGEVGFLPFGRSPGRRVMREQGMLEAALSADALVSYAKQAGMPGDPSVTDVYAAAHDRDPAALQTISHQVEMLALLLASVFAVLDPELVVVGGGIGRNFELLGEGLTTRLAEITPLRSRLAISSLGRDAAVRGAIVRGVDLARAAEFTARMNPADPATQLRQQIS